MTAGGKGADQGLANRMLFETRPEQAIAIKLSCSLITMVVVLVQRSLNAVTIKAG